MTQQHPPDRDDRRTAARIAAAHTAASGDLETFLHRLPPALAPADIAEYATLLAREQAIRVDRDAALNRLGLTASSIEPD